MIIAVEDAPYLIMSASATPLDFASLVLLVLDGPLHQLERAGGIRIDRYVDTIAMTAVPLSQVCLLGPQSFTEDVQLETDCSGRTASDRWPGASTLTAQPPTPAVMLSAIAANCCFERMGVAP